MHDRYIDSLRTPFEQLMAELEDILHPDGDAIDQLIREVDAALARPLTPAEQAH